MVKSWQNRGVFLWQEYVYTVNTVAGTSNYATPTAFPFLSIDKAYIRDDSNDIPLEIISFRKYQDVLDKSEQGFPSRLAHDNRSGLIYLHEVPDSIYALYALGIVKLKDWDTTGASGGDLPDRFLQALIFGLAYSLSFEYPVSAGDRRELKQFADQEFQTAKNMDMSLNTDDCKHVASNFPNRWGR